jgi:hypothetical protein
VADGLEREDMTARLDPERRAVEVLGEQLAVHAHADVDHVGAGAVLHLEDYAGLRPVELVEPPRAVVAYHRRTARADARSGELAVVAKNLPPSVGVDALLLRDVGPRLPRGERCNGHGDQRPSERSHKHSFLKIRLPFSSK